MATDQLAELFEAEPQHVAAVVDGGVSECFDQVRFAGAGRESDRLQHLRRVLPCEVRVLSSLHPLFGRLLLASGFRRRDGQLLLVVGLPDGSPGTIAAECTDVFGEQAEALLDVAVSASVLTVDGVRRLMVLLAALDAGGSRKLVRGQK